MSTNHHTAAITLMLFLIRGVICTSNDICNSYAVLEDYINEITESDRERCGNMVFEIFNGTLEYHFWSDDLQDILTGCCNHLGQMTIYVKNVTEESCILLNEDFTSKIHLNEICNGRSVSSFLSSEIDGFRDCYSSSCESTWNLTEECNNATQLLREECIAMERETEDESFYDGPQNVASRMNKAMDECMFRRNLSVEKACSGTNSKWKLYVLVSEFLERIHPGVRYDGTRYTRI